MAGLDAIGCGGLDGDLVWVGFCFRGFGRLDCVGDGGGIELEFYCSVFLDCRCMFISIGLNRIRLLS